jgi:23S rRNA (guanosine2251-2'-O)-methyltransferase
MVRPIQSRRGMSKKGGPAKPKSGYSKPPRKASPYQDSPRPQRAKGKPGPRSGENSESPIRRDKPTTEGRPPRHGAYQQRKRPQYGAFEEKRERYGDRGEERRERYGDRGEESATAEQDSDLIYGRHSVLAALQSERPLNRIWVLSHLRYDPRFHSLIDQAKRNGATVDEIDSRRLDFLTHHGKHQGIAVQVAAAEYLDLGDLVTQAKAATSTPLLIALDGIKDPHNLGAIIRTAEALGAQGVIVPQRRAVGLTSTVMKVAAGAVESLPIARVTNLNQALEQLKGDGFWIYGLSATGNLDLPALEAGSDALVLVVGAEGEGLSLLTQKHCDRLISIPLLGKSASLNASVAAGMALYEIFRQRWLQRVHLSPTKVGKI